MSADTPPEPDTDRAWVSIDTGLEPERLVDFCRDVERLFRINPYLEFSAWEHTAPRHHVCTVLNHSTGLTQRLEMDIKPETGGGFSVYYDQGIKAYTRFEVAARPGGSKLTITEDYTRLPPEERSQHLDEVDRSLSGWGQALHDYLRLQRRWAWFPPWRWYMRRLWLPMTPMARRVSYMLVVINGGFFALFVLVMLIYKLEGFG